MMRSWAGWYAAALAGYYQRATPRPLLVVLDCKGGPDARTKARLPKHPIQHPGHD
jgi:hypothetical protein